MLLDTAESFYMTALINALKEEDDNDEIQRLLLKYINNYEDDGKASLQFNLIESYIQTNNFQEAFNLCKELKETGYYYCSDLKKYKKYFDKLPDYNTYMKTCKEK